MEKNRLVPSQVPGSKSIRMSYARKDDVLEMPDLIEVQRDSYEWFLTEGLAEVFQDIFPDFYEEVLEMTRKIKKIKIRNKFTIEFS